MYLFLKIEDTVWDENSIEKPGIKDAAKEITTHVSIHTLHLDGLRELYRHFLRLPDGAIVEVSALAIVVTEASMENIILFLFVVILEQVVHIKNKKGFIFAIIHPLCSNVD